MLVSGAEEVQRCASAVGSALRSAHFLYLASAYERDEAARAQHLAEVGVDGKVEVLVSLASSRFGPVSSC